MRDKDNLFYIAGETDIRAKINIYIEMETEKILILQFLFFYPSLPLQVRGSSQDRSPLAQLLRLLQVRRGLHLRYRVRRLRYI